jgi:hypothetical protein
MLRPAREVLDPVPAIDVEGVDVDGEEKRSDLGCAGARIDGNGLRGSGVATVRHRRLLVEI